MNEELIGDLQSEDEKVAALRKLYEFCASGEFRRYRQEVTMQKLKEEIKEAVYMNPKVIVCPDCGYAIVMDGYSNALAVELIENKKSALMCPMCFTPFHVENEERMEI